MYSAIVNSVCKLYHQTAGVSPTTLTGTMLSSQRADERLRDAQTERQAHNYAFSGAGVLSTNRAH